MKYAYRYKGHINIEILGYERRGTMELQQQITYDVSFDVGSL